MVEPLTFTTATPRYALPCLFAGQAQKEFFVNEALAITDMLLHPAIEAEGVAPPDPANNGECWLVGTGATGAWEGKDGLLASRQAGIWLFVTPRPGMAVFDKALGQVRRFDGGWHVAAAVTAPAGGSVIDAEARSAIGDLILALQAAGVLPST